MKITNVSGPRESTLVAVLRGLERAEQMYHILGHAGERAPLTVHEVERLVAKTCYPLYKYMIAR